MAPPAGKCDAMARSPPCPESPLLPSLPLLCLTGALASESQPLGRFLWFLDARMVLGFELLPVASAGGGAGVDGEV